MRPLDRALQRWRCGLARRHVPRGADVLDVGCHHGEFLRSLAGHAGQRVGYDPLAPPQDDGGLRLVAAPFLPPTAHPDASFDVVTMLATLEHVQEKEALAREFRRVLRPQGRAIVTVPSLAVDQIVAVLHRLRLVDGMSLEEHHGFRPEQTVPIFTGAGFELVTHRPFQLGLNHLYVFRVA